MSKVGFGRGHDREEAVRERDKEKKDAFNVSSEIDAQLSSA